MESLGWSAYINWLLNARIYITFNFDNLFEHYVDRMHTDKKTVLRLGQQVDRRYTGQIDSYHIHGILPSPSFPQDVPVELVFDLISYLEKYRTVNDCLFSITLLHVMTNYRCVFLGLSMTIDLIKLIVNANALRTGDGCWGLVYGRMRPELAALLEEWGLGVVHLVQESSDFGRVPTGIMEALAQVDPPDMNSLHERFSRIW